MSMKYSSPVHLMKREILPCVVALFFSAVSSAGVGVWTTNNTVGSRTLSVDLGSGALYANGGAHGLLRSSDNGQTWQDVSVVSALPGYAGDTLPLATGPSGTAYAVATFGSEGVNDGWLYVSRDNGSNWTLLAQPQGVGTFVALLVDPFTPTTLYASPALLQDFFGTITRSTDNGATWSDITPNPYPGHPQAVTAAATDPKTRNTLYVAITGVLNPQLYKSIDSGTTWTLLNGDLPGLVNTLAIDPVTTSTLYAGVGSTGTFRSDDGGGTFRSLNNFAPAQVVIDPNHPNRIYVATQGQGVQVSSDGGVTWEALNAGLTDLTVYALALDSVRGFLHAGTDSGVFDLQLASPPCVSDAHTLCLNNGRFSVMANFQATPEAPSAPATAVPLTSDTGYFWFFDPTNIELVVKVLTGCTVNGEYWVFAGGLTDVGVQLKVTDTLTGAVKNYSNPVGTPFQPIQDTSAFPCP